MASNTNGGRHWLLFLLTLSRVKNTLGDNNQDGMKP